MDENIYLVLTIKNILSVFCWVFLAMIFDKWWIALFALLFIGNIKQTTYKYYRFCDGCGKHGELANSEDEALGKVINDGWVHYKNDKDYCPDCQLKFRR